MDAKEQNNVHSCKNHKFSYKVFFLFLNLACLLKGLFHGHLMEQIGSIIILHAWVALQHWDCGVSQSLCIQLEIPNRGAGTKQLRLLEWKNGIIYDVQHNLQKMTFS